MLASISTTFNCTAEQLWDEISHWAFAHLFSRHRQRRWKKLLRSKI